MLSPPSTSPRPNLGVMFPPNFTSALASLAIVNLDILPSLNLACMYDFNYINKVYVTTLAPIAISVVLFLGMLIMKGGNVKKAGSAAATPFLAFTFIIFISTSSAVFGYFKCDEVGPPSTGNREGTKRTNLGKHHRNGSDTLHHPLLHHPSPVTRHPSPVTRHPSPVTRHPSPSSSTLTIRSLS